MTKKIAEKSRLVTLLPGEEVTIGVRGWKTPDPDTARSALYCVEPTR